MNETEMLRERHDMVHAMLNAATHPREVMEACSGTEGGREAVIAAISDAIDVTPFWAEIVSGMSISQFSPHSVESLKAELTDIRARLGSVNSS